MVLAGEPPAKIFAVGFLLLSFWRIDKRDLLRKPEGHGRVSGQSVERLCGGPGRTVEDAVQLEEMLKMGIRYEHLISKGITPAIMAAFRLPMSSWVELGHGRTRGLFSRMRKRKWFSVWNRDRPRFGLV